jgi:hypothetical protein
MTVFLYFISFCVFYYTLSALRPSDRTNVRSKCPRHFSALLLRAVLRYTLRVALSCVQNAPGILVVDKFLMVVDSQIHSIVCRKPSGFHAGAITLGISERFNSLAGARVISPYRLLMLSIA